MNKFQRSWLLFKSSLAVLFQNRTLLVFPLVTAGCTVLILLFFLTPVAFQQTGYSYGSQQHWEAVRDGIIQPAPEARIVPTNATAESQPVTTRHGRNSENIRLQPHAYAYLAGLYFVAMLVATFFNVAFYSEILKALNGQAVSIAAGLRFAATKWQSILLWALFAGVVGYLIKTLEERFGFIGRLVMRLVGTAWSIASIFVIPVMIREESTVNPLAMLKQSAFTLKKTWGESLIGYAGVSFGGLIILISSFVLLGAGIGLSVVLNTPWIIAIVGVGWVISLIAVMYLMSVASQIFRCALYLYATDGAIPQPFTPEMIAMAWKMKKTPVVR
jgi:hypothetical protein